MHEAAPVEATMKKKEWKIRQYKLKIYTEFRFINVIFLLDIATDIVEEKIYIHIYFIFLPLFDG